MQQESGINSKELSIGVVCRYPFPEGLAATNRIISYLKGLVYHNAKCTVYIYSPTENYKEKKVNQKE